MITKELFIETMEHLEDFDERLNDVDKAFKKLNPDFCGFYLTEPVGIVIKILTECFNDKDGWLDYFVWECGWLKELEYGDVLVHDEPVDLSDWGKVYDFLTEGKNNGNSVE